MYKITPMQKSVKNLTVGNDWNGELSTLGITGYFPVRYGVTFSVPSHAIRGRLYQLKFLFRSLSIAG